MEDSATDDSGQDVHRKGREALPRPGQISPQQRAKRGCDHDDEGVLAEIRCANKDDSDGESDRQR
jgi:hypothetical protein